MRRLGCTTNFLCLFDAVWYLERYPDVAAAGVDPLVHFIEHGAKELRDPCPLFSTTWYCARNPDLRPKDVNPLDHYLTVGSHFDPHPLFDTCFYLAANPEVAQSRINPLVHYRTSEPSRVSDPHPLFDSKWYLANNLDGELTVSPLEHFIRFGAAEGRNPNPLFDTNLYFSRYPDVRASGANPLIHYVVHGVAEGRDPSSEFDTAWYLSQNAEVVRGNMNPLTHYVLFGRAEGRRAIDEKRRAAALAALDQCLSALAAIEPALAGIAATPDFRMIAAASGQAFGRHYTAWKDLFNSLAQPYTTMVFLSGKASSTVNRFAADALRAAHVKFGSTSTLAVITDCDPTEDLNLPSATQTRTLSHLNPQLTLSDRANIVTSLIYYVRPQAVLNINSAALWLAIAERGGALNTVSRLFASAFSLHLPGEGGVPDGDVKKGLRHLAGLYALAGKHNGAPIGDVLAAMVQQLRSIEATQPSRSRGLPEGTGYISIPDVDLYLRPMSGWVDHA